MRFIRYLDHRYQELMLDASRKSFSSLRSGHSNALVFVLKTYSVVIATLFIPWVFADYLLVLLHLRPQPKPAVDLAKAEARAAEAKAQAEAQHRNMAKKIGFQKKKEAAPA